MTKKLTVLVCALILLAGCNKANDAAEQAKKQADQAMQQAKQLADQANKQAQAAMQQAGEMVNQADVPPEI